MNKKIGIVFLFVPFLSLTSCSSYKIPVFDETDGIRFTAYNGPTVENWNGVKKNVNTITDEHYRKLAEAGFNKVLAIYEGEAYTTSNVTETLTRRYEKAQQDALQALACAEKVGIKYCVRDWDFYGLYAESEYPYKNGIRTYEDYVQAMKYIFPDDCQYVHSSAYSGNFACDEPNYDQLERVQWQIEAYMNRMAELGVTDYEPNINLNPINVNMNSLSGSGLITYEEYIQKYFETIAPLTGYVSYDFYPFTSTDGSYIKSMYLANLEMLATYCKLYDVELRTFIQAEGDFTGIRDMTSINDFRFQIAVNMAFGSHEMAYYQYCTEYDVEDGEFGLLNYMTGEYNWTYDAVKIANNEAHQMEDAYLAYNWDGVMFHNGNELYDNQNFANLSNPLESHKRVSIVDSDQDTLLTTFKHKKTGDDAFMLVNFTDPYYSTNDTVTLKFKNAKALLMYRYGQKVIVTLPSSGVYKFVLAPGEGRFIIPLK